jgi:hypothetical protein
MRAATILAIACIAFAQQPEPEISKAPKSARRRWT